ncbi:methyltransferase domain-containing protein [Elioraea sp. Yellowstone]|jgi:cyclopropane fatty-acyl-phospholipid synthase-like methyltransferase|uniref:class I SAM-dependent methyltransferase n=1 Tax=Elioraea sp. Yellowstone TaxID=2592070 RepID=UPI001152AE07|nr:methyltransferase domain-containing protein [Elioraea sp. Yellowstone]TQF78803.1 methyltransferase domain-containing protein [Elioraea sp. Yellowstone]
MRGAFAQVLNWFGSPAGGRSRAVAPQRPVLFDDRVPPAVPQPAPHRRLDPEPPPPPPERWPETKLKVLGALWGEGFLGPGGAEETLKLAKPLGLNQTHSVINLGAGLGGATRVLAAASGAWVTGYETDPDLAEAAQALSEKHKVEKKAEIRPLDPANPQIRKGYYHHALALEALWRIADKPAMIAALVGAVKPQGQVVLTDLALGPPSPAAERAFAAWAKLEGVTPCLTGEKAITTLLAKEGLDVRICEDITSRHIAQTVVAWASFVEELKRDRPARPFALRVVEEAERCMRRIDLLRSGRLRLLRWHAIRR